MMLRVVTLHEAMLRVVTLAGAVTLAGVAIQAGATLLVVARRHRGERRHAQRHRGRGRLGTLDARLALVALGLALGGFL